jgi:hypothetical protein
MIANQLKTHETAQSAPISTSQTGSNSRSILKYLGSNSIGLPALIIGPKGLRAGWRLLIFLLMLVAMGSVARAIIIRFLIPAGFSPEKFTPLKVAVPDAFFAFIVTVAAWVMSKIEGRKISQYGLPVKKGLMKHL